MPRTIIAMSGGVDSSVAAVLLHEQGHDCAGVHLKLYVGPEDAPIREKSCCSLSDAEDARATAHLLGLPFYVFNFTREFEATVMRRFAEGYQRGETPNPCIDCNRFIKFSALLDKARTLEYDSIATGHYVRREWDAAAGRWLLRKGRDPGKDQSYVLSMLTQDQLAHTYFPLGDLEKAYVRELAGQHGLLNARKRDSQDICFVPEGGHGAFLAEYTGQPLRTGNFVTTEGRVLGRHRGTPCYTLGQRKGLGLALPRPGYVCAIDPAEATVTVGDEALLFRRSFEAYELNFIAYETLAGPLRCKAKVRYRQTEQWATAERIGSDRLRITFDEAQRAITPGQAVVLYEGEYVLGGGTIAP